MTTVIRRNRTLIIVFGCCMIIASLAIAQILADMNFKSRVRNSLARDGYGNADLTSYPERIIIEQINSGIRNREALGRLLVEYNERDVQEMPFSTTLESYTYKVGWLGHIFPSQIEIYYARDHEADYRVKALRIWPWFGLMMKEYGVDDRGARLM